MTEQKTRYCSFCAKSEHEVRTLVAGPMTLICNECVVECLDLITRRAVRGELGEVAAQTVCAGKITADMIAAGRIRAFDLSFVSAAPDAQKVAP